MRSYFAEAGAVSDVEFRCCYSKRGWTTRLNIQSIIHIHHHCGFALGSMLFYPSPYGGTELLISKSRMAYPWLRVQEAQPPGS